ncbi:Peroxiredoxin-2 [Trichoplax sp. H2]|nr:Peroxiredoxin-2 [Trichoplax sp. H2]|eukprot:RDD38010.1 Peroxiredoxin-2 [Trichoplax sp. H2]
MSKAKVQYPAPDFHGIAVVDGDFREIQLSDYVGKYLVFFFYPMDFTFVCPTEIIAFSNRAKDFREINCEVVACSTDSEYSHLAWTNVSRNEGGLGKMDIPILADKTKSIARDYGVLIEDDGVALRGLFIINGRGILKQITINDLPVGRSVDEVLRLVKAFQFTDKHGEVCPANWSPGSKTVKEIFTFRVSDPSSAKPLNKIDLHRHVDKNSTKPNDEQKNNNGSRTVATTTNATNTSTATPTAAKTAMTTTTNNNTTIAVQNNTNHDKNSQHHHNIYSDMTNQNGSKQNQTSKSQQKATASSDQQQLVYCKICTLY